MVFNSIISKIVLKFPKLFLTNFLILATCGYPGSPAHASVTFSSDNLEIGTVATYVCNNGYELLGPHRRLCKSDLKWEPAGIPFCGKSNFNRYERLFWSKMIYWYQINQLWNFDFRYLKFIQIDRKLVFINDRKYFNRSHMIQWMMKIY